MTRPPATPDEPPKTGTRHPEAAGTTENAAGAAWPSPARPDERVTVVMITHNRRAEALLALSRLHGLSEAPGVIVVDNGSSDGTADAIAREHPWAQLIASPENLGAVGRNVAVARVQTPYVAFCDDDTWWAPGSLARAADGLDRVPDLAAVTARIVVEPGGHDDPVVEELRDSPVVARLRLPGPAIGSFLAGASMLRVAAFRDCGGFNERLWLGGEEELLAADLQSAGWELCYLAEAVVHHEASKARDARLRRRHGIRNTLWFIWLRRRLPGAVRRTRDVLAGAPRDRTTLLAVLDALAGVPWVVCERRPLARPIEARFKLLEHAQRTSKARRYVG